MLAVLFDNYKKKINNIISEQYIQAGLYLNKREDEAKTYMKIFYQRKMFFYSTLALEHYFRKNLESDKKNNFKYFKIIEDLKLPKEKKDLVTLKKALYLLSVSDIDNGKKFFK